MRYICLMGTDDLPQGYWPGMVMGTDDLFHGYWVCSWILMIFSWVLRNAQEGEMGQ